MVKDVKWVSTRNTLDSFRNNGITTEEGICELIDNSIDARASEINIMLEETGQDEYLYTIIDNGCGIPTTFEDPEDIEGVPLQGIRYALSVGGKMNIYGTKKIGRFGFGLSSTVAELSARSDVYSKTVDDDKWRYSFYDYNWLKENNLVIPEEEYKQPPIIVIPKTGTIIQIRVKRSKRLNLKSLQNRLIKRIGQFYASMLHSSVKIGISIKNLKGNWNIVDISPNDYLWREPESRNVKLYGKSISKGEVEIVIDSNHALVDAIESKISFPQVIRIEMVLLDAESISSISGIKPETGFGEWLSLMQKLGIGMDSQGYSLSRNGRIIDTGKDIGYSKIGPLNFFRATIHFPSELDELFGIQNNKNKSRIYEPLQNLIGSKCNATISQIRTDHQDVMSRIRLKKVSRPHEASLAEVHVGKIQDILPRPKITPQERIVGLEGLKKVIELAKEEIIVEGKKKLAEGRVKLDTATEIGDTAEVEKIELELSDIESQIDQDIRDIEERFDEESGRLVRFSPSSPRPIGSGAIYNIESFGDIALVTLNSETTFFHNVYARAAMKKWDKFLLDLMIFSMAYSEHIAKSDIGNPNRARHWAENRRDISTMIHRFIEPISNETISPTCSICDEDDCEHME